jgi:hypothetical protein
MSNLKSVLSIFIAALSNAALPAIAQECKPLDVQIAVDMRLERGVPTIPVKIGNQAKKLVVNTGSAFSVLSQPAIKDMKLNTLQARVRLFDNAGQQSDRYVTLPSLEIGSGHSNAIKFMVRPAPGPMNPNDSDLAGVLGPDILQNFDVDMDFGARKLQLVSSDHCDGKVLYWTAPVVAIVPMRVAGEGRPVIFVNLDGKRLEAVLNTGQVNTVLNLDVAEDRFSVDVNAPDVKQVGQVGQNASAKVYRKQFQTLTFEGVTIENPEINLVPDQLKTRLLNKNRPTTGKLGSLTRGDEVGSRLPDLTLGMSTLARLHVYIAYREKKVYITESAPAPKGL